MKTRRRAFTLIELLIVITIIGILAVALVPRITGGAGRARDAQRRTALQSLSVALETYMSDNGAYPASNSGCVPATELSVYLTTDITDPQSSPAGDCGDGYGYYQLQDGDGYILVAALETLTDTGNGIYSAPNVDTASDAQANLDAFTPCAGNDCSAGAYYVVGR